VFKNSQCFGKKCSKIPNVLEKSVQKFPMFWKKVFKNPQCFGKKCSKIPNVLEKSVQTSLCFGKC
jgi:hypothetical protein